MSDRPLSCNTVATGCGSEDPVPTDKIVTTEGAASCPTDRVGCAFVGLCKEAWHVTGTVVTGAGDKQYASAFLPANIQIMVVMMASSFSIQAMIQRTCFKPTAGALIIQGTPCPTLAPSLSPLINPPQHTRTVVLLRCNTFCDVLVLISKLATSVPMSSRDLDKTGKTNAQCQDDCLQLGMRITCQQAMPGLCVSPKCKLHTTR